MIIVEMYNLEMNKYLFFIFKSVTYVSINMQQLKINPNENVYNTNHINIFTQNVYKYKTIC